MARRRGRRPFRRPARYLRRRVHRSHTARELRRGWRRRRCSGVHRRSGLFGRLCLEVPLRRRPCIHRIPFGIRGSENHRGSGILGRARSAVRCRRVRREEPLSAHRRRRLPGESPLLRRHRGGHAIRQKSGGIDSGREAGEVFEMDLEGPDVRSEIPRRASHLLIMERCGDHRCHASIRERILGTPGGYLLFSVVRSGPECTWGSSWHSVWDGERDCLSKLLRKEIYIYY